MMDKHQGRLPMPCRVKHFWLSAVALAIWPALGGGSQVYANFVVSEVGPGGMRASLCEVPAQCGRSEGFGEPDGPAANTFQTQSQTLGWVFKWAMGLGQTGAGCGSPTGTAGGANPSF